MVYYVEQHKRTIYILNKATTTTTSTKRNGKICIFIYVYVAPRQAHTHKRQKPKKKENQLFIYWLCDVVHKVAADKIKSMPFD